MTSDESVAEFASHLDHVDLLVNNAGGAKGLEPLVETTIEDWQWMYEVNVLGTVRMIQALMPKLEGGLIINMGSVAGWNVYEGGSGYNAAKHGVRVISRALRIEEHGVRVTELDPGRVATEEFSSTASAVTKRARRPSTMANSTSARRTSPRQCAGWQPFRHTSTSTP